MYIYIYINNKYTQLYYILYILYILYSIANKISVVAHIIDSGD